MDIFIKLARARNHLIETRNRSIHTVIESEEYVFTIREKQKRIESKDKWHAFDYEPTGLLVMGVGKFYDKKEFIDGRQPLENQLSKVLAYLEYLADYWKEIRLKNEVERKEREAKERLIQETRDREKREKGKFNDFIDQANRWHQANILREYINEVEKKADEMNPRVESYQEWITWAKEKADWYDPLVGKPNEFLTDYDK